MNRLSVKVNRVLDAPTFALTKPVKAYHPSSASLEYTDSYGHKQVIGACLRQQYYKRTQAPITNRGITDWKISSMLGDKFHEMLVEFIDEHGFHMGIQKLAAEQPFYNPMYDISGKVDMLIWDYTAHEMAGIEIKSVGEAKANKCLEEPAKEHVMQSMIYLDYYQTYIPKDQVRPTKWYIWYLSRTENWSIKGKKHGSPLAMLWDYEVTLDNQGDAVIETIRGKEKWPGFNINNIYKRYKDLDNYITSNTLPPRDYQEEYDEATILGMYKQNKLQYKKHKEPVEKWIKKGMKPGELKLTMGDFECAMCEFKEHCWRQSQQSINSSEFNLPNDLKSSSNEDSDSDFIF